MKIDVTRSHHRGKRYASRHAVNPFLPMYLVPEVVLRGCSGCSHLVVVQGPDVSDVAPFCFLSPQDVGCTAALLAVREAISGWMFHSFACPPFPATVVTLCPPANALKVL